MKLNILMMSVCSALCVGSAYPGLSDPTTSNTPSANHGPRIVVPRPMVLPPEPAPSTIHMTAQFVSPTVTVGDMVLLRIVIKNDGIDRIYVPSRGSAWLNFHLSVKNSSGSETPLTAWGKLQQRLADQPIGPEINLDMGVVLQHGQQVTYQLVLNRQFDLSQIGVYHVIVTQPGIDIANPFRQTLPISSNLADVELTEPSPNIESIESAMH